MRNNIETGKKKTTSRIDWEKLETVESRFLCNNCLIVGNDCHQCGECKNRQKTYFKDVPLSEYLPPMSS